MSVKDGTETRVSFNTRDELGDKIDKLTVVMSRLAAKDTHEKRPFKPQIYKSKGQHRSYGWESYQSRLGSRNRGQFMENRPRGNNFKGNTRGYVRQNNTGNYGNERYNDYNRDRDRSRERTFTRNYGSNRDRSSSNNR